MYINNKIRALDERFANKQSFTSFGNTLVAYEFCMQSLHRNVQGNSTACFNIRASELFSCIYGYLYDLNDLVEKIVKYAIYI